MNPMKLKLLEEILGHLSDSQAGDLKSLLDEGKSPKMPDMEEGSDKEESMESPDEEAMEKDPKGLSVEKISILGKPKTHDDHVNDAIDDASDEDSKKKLPGEEDEMSDDELRELIAKHLK